MNSGELSKQRSQVAGVCRIAQKGTDSKDLLKGAKGGAMGVVVRVGVAMTPRAGGENDHADRAIASLPLIPCDEEDPSLLVGAGSQDLRYGVGEPGVALTNGIGDRRA